MSDALHNVQAPMGPQASALFDLWTIMLIVCALVFVLVMAAVVVAMWRARRGGRAGSLATLPDMAPHPRRDKAVRRAVGWATAVSTVLLVGLLFASFLTDRAIARLPSYAPHTLRLPLGRRIVSAANRHQFYTVRLQDGAAYPAFKGSGDITSLSMADGYIEIPADQSTVEEGSNVTVTLF